MLHCCRAQKNRRESEMPSMQSKGGPRLGSDGCGSRGAPNTGPDVRLAMNPERQDTGLEFREGKYTNCFQIGHNAFEFVLEFGQSYDQQPELIHTRLVMSPAFAAQLSQLLSQALVQYEDRFGPISVE